jgi:hypothetical protein
MERTQLSGQHTLIEPSVAGAQNRPTVLSQLDCHAHSRRQNVPRVQLPQSFDDLVRFIPFSVERGQVLADGVTVIDRTPAFTVTRSFTVKESLANSAVVLNLPPEIAGAREIA